MIEMQINSTRRRTARLIAGLLAIILLPLAGCGDGNPFEDDGRLRLVTTTAMVRDIAAHVAGDRAQIINLMGEGSDPHLYQPSRRDDLALQHADVILYSGLMLEGRMGDTFTRMAAQGKSILAVAEAVDPSRLLDNEDYPGQPDPHVWMDVAAWSQCVDAVANKLAELDPEHADFYHANAASYREQLAGLDEYVKQVTASIPESQRVLVTAHDAFGYFGRAYGIEVRGVQGISTISEAGTRDILDLVDYLVEHRIPAVFFETSVREHSVRALVEGTARQGHAVQIGGTLFSDAMGPAGTYEGTYIGMIDHNATTITRALGGNAPQSGWQGKLTGD